jgi:hypothetical protein
VTESGTKYATAAEAKSALDLKRPPAVMQEIEIIRLVDGVESGIKGGAPDARQVILPTKDCYRIVREVPIK